MAAAAEVFIFGKQGCHLHHEMRKLCWTPQCEFSLKVFCPGVERDVRKCQTETPTH